MMIDQEPSTPNPEKPDASQTPQASARSEADRDRAATRPARKGPRALKIVGTTLGALVAVVGLGAVSLTLSPVQHWVLEKGLTWVPGLSVQKVDGDFSAFQLHHVVYNDSGISASIDQLDWAVGEHGWHWFLGKINVKTLTLDKVRASVKLPHEKDAKPETTSEKPLALPAWLDFTLSNFAVNDANITVDDITWQSQALSLKNVNVHQALNLGTLTCEACRVTLAADNVHEERLANPSTDQAKSALAKPQAKVSNGATSTNPSVNTAKATTSTKATKPTKVIEANQAKNTASSPKDPFAFLDYLNASHTEAMEKTLQKLEHIVLPFPIKAEVVLKDFTFETLLAKSQTEALPEAKSKALNAKARVTTDSVPLRLSTAQTRLTFAGEKDAIHLSLDKNDPALSIHLTSAWQFNPGWDVDTQLTIESNNLRNSGLEVWVDPKELLPNRPFDLVLTLKGNIARALSLNLETHHWVKTHLQTHFKGANALEASVDFEVEKNAPIIGEVAWFDRSNMTLKGPLSDLKLQGTLYPHWVGAKHLPVNFTPIQLDASLKGREARIEAMSIFLKKGQTRPTPNETPNFLLTGAAHLVSNPTYETQVTLNRFNLAPWMESVLPSDLSGRTSVLSGSLVSSGSIPLGLASPIHNQSTMNFNGTLFDRPFKSALNNTLELRPHEAVKAEGSLALTMLDSDLKATIKLDKTSDATLELQVPNLAKIARLMPADSPLASLTGSLNTKANLSGSALHLEGWPAPEGKAALTLSANDLSLTVPATVERASEAMRLNRLNLVLDPTQWALKSGERYPQIEGALTLDAQGLDVDGAQPVHLNTLKARLAGTSQSHNLSINALLNVPEIEALRPYLVKAKLLPPKAAKGQTAQDSTKRVKPAAATTVAKGKGTAEKTTLVFKTSAPTPAVKDPVRFTLALEGHLDAREDRYRSTLSTLALDTPVGSLKNTMPSTITVNLDQGDILVDQWQLSSNQAALGRMGLTKPLRINRLGERIDGALSFEQFNLGLLNPWLPNAIKVKGLLNASATLMKDGTAPLALTSHVSTSELSFTPFGATPDQVIHVDTLALNLKSENNRAKANLDLNYSVGEASAKPASIRLDLGINHLDSTRELDGQLMLEGINPATANPFLQGQVELNGLLHGNVNFGGTLMDPRLYGDIELKEWLLNTSLATLKMKPSLFTIHFDGQDSSLTGAIRTESSDLDVKGHAQWAQDADGKLTPKARVTVKSQDFKMGLPSYGNVFVSPQIQANFNGKAMTVVGVVKIPKADLTINSLPPSAVGPSDDLVMLNNQLKPLEPRQSSIPLELYMIVTLGKEVNVNVFDLKALLTGKLILSQGPTGLSANGEISIPQGTFEAYGQDLLIENGRITFAGPPDQPYVNIKAIRNPQNTENGVVAGLSVQGPAKAPQLKVFSSPAMSQAQALSYLLRGMPMSTKDNDTGLLTSAILGLGLSQTGQVVNKIGDAIGVHNLAVDAVGQGNDTKVVVSATLLPGLQLKYGVGLFDSLMTLTLRYRLLNSLYLEAMTGTGQSLDMLYHLSW